MYDHVYNIFDKNGNFQYSIKCEQRMEVIKPMFVENAAGCKISSCCSSYDESQKFIFHIYALKYGSSELAENEDGSPVDKRDKKHKKDKKHKHEPKALTADDFKKLKEALTKGGNADERAEKMHQQLAHSKVGEIVIAVDKKCDTQITLPGNASGEAKLQILLASMMLETTFQTEMSEGAKGCLIFKFFMIIYLAPWLFVMTLVLFGEGEGNYEGEEADIMRVKTAIIMGILEEWWVRACRNCSEKLDGKAGFEKVK